MRCSRPTQTGDGINSEACGVVGLLRLAMVSTAETRVTTKGRETRLRRGRSGGCNEVGRMIEHEISAREEQ